MSGQRLITDVFAQHKKEVDRSRKAKAADDEAKSTNANGNNTLQRSPLQQHQNTNINITNCLDDEAARALLREKELSVLHQFDLCWKYGPSTGITRLERWERAEKHGKNPPDLIRQIIQRNPEAEEYTQSLWHDYPL